MLFLRKFPAYSLFMGAFSSCATYYIWALCYFFSFVIFALSTFIGCTTTNLYCLFFIFLLFCPLLPICSNLSLCLCFYFLPLNDPSVFIFFRMLCFRLWVFALRVTGLLLRFYPFFLFPYTPWAGILRKVHFPKFFLMKQSNLSHVRLGMLCHAFC